MRIAPAQSTLLATALALSALLISLSMAATTATATTATAAGAESFQTAFAQEEAGGMKQPTTGGSLDVVIEPSPTPANIDNQTDFKITFLTANTETPQLHVDYDFVITQGDQEVFRASKQLNQPLLHTEPGIVTIPYKFENGGDYTLKVQVFGILFQPISPESAEFPITVVPEFPAGVMGAAAAALVAAAAVASRKLKFKS